MPHAFARKPLPKPNPKSDPRYLRVMEQLKSGAVKTRAHPPAAKKAADAAAASKGPPNERMATGKAKQVDKIKEAPTKKPESNAFLTLLRAEIDKAMPKTLGDTEKFMKGGSSGQLKGSLKGNVSQQKTESAGQVAGASSQQPAPAGEAKQEKPLPKEGAAAPPQVAAGEGMPAPKSDADVSLQDSKADTDDQMKEAEVTTPQLQKANDPRFSAVVEAKGAVAKQADAAPGQYRAAETATLSATAATANAQARQGAARMIGVRTASGSRVLTRQQQQKAKDEARRKEITDKIEKIFTDTKARVDKKLADLDTEVGTMFDQGTEKALAAMTDYVESRILRYKLDRYLSIPIVGAARWIRDQFKGLPEEANVFYEEGRRVFQRLMDALIVRVANLVELRLKEAKAEVAKGQADIKAFVASQPRDLQQFAQQAAKEVSSRFEELERGIEDKKNELAASLANKYKEAFDKANEALKKIQDSNKGLVAAFMEKLGEIIKILREFKDRVMGLLRKGKETIDLIVADPIGFLKNLIAAIKGGISAFLSNIWTHLKKGFMTWLFGSLAEAGIEIPSDLSLPSILKLVLGVLGITYDRMRAKAVKLIGERNVKIIEKLVEYVRALITGGPAALWEKVKEDLSNLKQMVIEAIQNWLIETIVKQAIAKIISMFNPAGAIIQAIIAIYNVVMFIIEKVQQILAFFEAVINSVHAIATGAISGAISWIEQALARTIPIVIGFLARLIGLGGISAKIKEFITKVQSKVDQAIDKAIAKLVAFVKKLFGGGGAKTADPDVQRRWTAGMQEVSALVQRAKRDHLDQPAIGSALVPIRERHGFKELILSTTGGKWRVHAVMNPEEWKEFEVGDGKDAKTFMVLIVGGQAVKVQYEGSEIDLPAEGKNNALVAGLTISQLEARELLAQLPTSDKQIPRTLLSFARKAGDPRKFLESILETGQMRMDAVEGPVSKHTRDRLVNLGRTDVRDPSSQRESLSHYAIVYRELFRGQFTPNTQKDVNKKGEVEHTFTEWQFRDPKSGARADTQVKPLGVVEVGDTSPNDGVIVKIVQVNATNVPGGKSALKTIIKGLGWRIRDDADS